MTHLVLLFVFILLRLRLTQTFSSLTALLAVFKRGFQLHSVHHLLLHETGPQSSSAEEPDTLTPQHEDEDYRGWICCGEYTTVNQLRRLY